MSEFNDKYNAIMAGTDDYGVPHGTPIDACSREPRNFPMYSKKELGLVAIGPKSE